MSTRTGAIPFAPVELSLSWTGAGRAVALVAGAALVLSWVGTGIAGFLAALCTSLLVLSALSARRRIAGLRLLPPPPARAHAGSLAELRPRLENVGAAALHAVFLSVGARVRTNAQDEGFVEELEFGARSAVALRARFAERGRHDTLVFLARSSFPFGLFEARARFDVPVDLVVYPRLRPFRERTSGWRARFPRAPLAIGPARGDEEFYGVRDWRVGEELRRVHWRLSAHRGRAILRLFRAPPEQPPELVLETDVPGPAVRRSVEFERAVGITATLAKRILSHGNALAFTLRGPGGTVHRRLRGRAGLCTAWSLLASVRPEFVDEPAGSADRSVREPDEHASEPGRRGRRRTHGRKAAHAGLTVRVGAQPRHVRAGDGVRLIDVTSPATIEASA